MQQRAAAAGYVIVNAAERADVVVVNTCSFIQSATEESIEAVLDALGEQGKKPMRPVIVAGCMPARFGAELEEALPEVAHFVPCSKEDDIVAVLESVVGKAELTEPTAASGTHTAPVWAYVKISDGCNRWCSFCTIPLIRGRYHSFSAQTIFKQVSNLVQGGTKEIVLIGQDTGIWGADLGNTYNLAWLLATLANAHPQARFRVMYTEPEGVTDELLDVLATRANVCAYLDIPLQHVVPHILHSMNRTGSAEQFTALVEHIRKAVPHITLRTTFIAGFPGETEEDFEQLLDFVQQGLFDYVGVFAYSQEEGTKAAKLPQQVPEDIKYARARQLRDEADSVSAALVAARVGTQCQVLIEGAEEDGQLYGRAASQAPEVDGVTYVSAGKPGDIVSVCIEDTLLYDMEGEVHA